MDRDLISNTEQNLQIMKTKVGFLLPAIIALTFSLTSCTKDNGPDPTPSDPRNNFTGTWSVYETPTKMNYQVEITLNTATADGVFIQNFGNPGYGNPAYARVSGNNITLDSDYTVGTDWVISGSGTRNNDKINWNYSISDGANTTSYVATYTKVK